MSNKGMLTAKYNRKIMSNNKTCFVVKNNEVVSNSYITNPIKAGVSSGECTIKPDMPNTYHKISMRTAHKLGFHNSGCIADMVNTVTLNNGMVIEPLKNNARVMVYTPHVEQMRVLVNTACRVFIQQHGWLSQKGVRELLKTYGYPVDMAMIKTIVDKYHASYGKGLKHNSRSAEAVDMACHDDDIDYKSRTSSYNTRLSNIIKCCFR